MRRCLYLARGGMGRCWPNPSVGCVLARADGTAIASARTADGGRPHAETLALERAGSARGATVYVSLEPCSHQGETPPCTDALIEAGVARVVAAIEDPNPKVAGRGIARLRGAGVKVDVGLMRSEADAIIAGHRTRHAAGRPWITVKVASSLDGAVAGKGRRRIQLTGERARAYTESLRAEHDAVMVGSGTALSDDPRLLPQNPGRQPQLRIVLDSKLSLSPDSQLLATTDIAPLWMVHEASAMPPHAFTGASLVAVDAVAPATPIEAALKALAEQGVGSVLCEAGPTLAQSLIEAECVDRLVWISAGKAIGDDGLAAVAGKTGARFQLHETFRIGNDVASHWEPAVPNL